MSVASMGLTYEAPVNVGLVEEACSIDDLLGWHVTSGATGSRHSYTRAGAAMEGLKDNKVGPC